MVWCIPGTSRLVNKILERRRVIVFGRMSYSLPIRRRVIIFVVDDLSPRSMYVVCTTFISHTVRLDQILDLGFLPRGMFRAHLIVVLA